MPNLSVLIIAKNEELHIGNNIRRLKKYLNPQEIIIIDDFSTDATAKIATELGVKVVQHALNGDFGAQRDFAISQATAKWILFLDADEYMTEALGCEIRKALTECDQSDKLYSFRLSFLHHFCGHPVHHLGMYPDYHMRLMPKDGAASRGQVHEEISSPYPTKDLPLTAHIEHYTYKSIEHQIGKINLYTSLGAIKLYERGKRTSLTAIIGHTLFGFVKMYVLQKGFLEGALGLFLSVHHAIAVFLKYAKLYIKQFEDRFPGIPKE